MVAPVVPAPEPPMIVAEEQPMAPPMSRETKGGRVLWYRLKVIQQPERARACGSGPKSSADRRPIDPPPVVELRIFEGKRGGTFEEALRNDVTFSYNANFFLYATLEHARAIAHGRMSAPSANTPPVLTGMPVSGMAYLDRPEEAGYFLFPDLSVRHEGRYRLVFNLYEETKEEADRNPGTPDRPELPGGMAAAMGGSFDYRMEVTSQDFIVYSAKKFPGLTESTTLSKVVAEQGCRVRIRRDVRMRRRDGKGSNDNYDNNEDEYRRRRTETPENVRDQYRARSMSGSVERTPYSASSDRRTSMAEYAQYPPPPTPSSNSHLGFLGGSSQYPPQPQAFAHPSSVPQSPSYPPPPSSGYPSQSSYPPPPPPQPSYHMERPPSQPYGAPNGAPQREQDRYEPVRKSSFAGPLPPVQSVSNSNYAQGGRIQLPPLPALTSSLASDSIPSPNHFQLPPRQNSGPSHPSQYPPPQALAGNKRSRQEVFRDDTDTTRLRNGERIDGATYDVHDSDVLTYKRADGGWRHKQPYGSQV